MADQPPQGIDLHAYLVWDDFARPDQRAAGPPARRHPSAADPAVADEGFDPGDPAVAELMAKRALAQAVALGSAKPLNDVDGDLIDSYPEEYREGGPRRATSDVAEMRRRHAERDDPLGLGPLPSWTAGQATVEWRYGADPAPPSFSGWLVFRDVSKRAATAERVDRLGQAERRWVEEVARTTPYTTEQALDVLDARRSLVNLDGGLTALAAASEPLLDELVEAELKESRAERRRHGHASVCPRHGPTKGGLCRRCSR